MKWINFLIEFFAYFLKSNATLKSEMVTGLGMSAQNSVAVIGHHPQSERFRFQGLWEKSTVTFLMSPESCQSSHLNEGHNHQTHYAVISSACVHNFIQSLTTYRKKAALSFTFPSPMTMEWFLIFIMNVSRVLHISSQINVSLVPHIHRGVFFYVSDVFTQIHTLHFVYNFSVWKQLGVVDSSMFISEIIYE